MKHKKSLQVLLHEGFASHVELALVLRYLVYSFDNGVFHLAN